MPTNNKEEMIIETVDATAETVATKATGSKDMLIVGAGVLLGVAATVGTIKVIDFAKNKHQEKKEAKAKVAVVPAE